MTQKVMVWDVFVRVFHWALVGLIAANLFFTAKGETVHEYVGYSAVALVVLRIVWGFVGSKYARFSDFFPTPKRIKAHLCALVKREKEDYLGHNALGALMIFALIAVILGLGFSGWAQTIDSPYYMEDWPENVHETLVTVLQILVALHVLAVIVMSIITKSDLVGAMFTGRKKVK
ncbi:cytochrome b/b6 domain-containing protein [Vitreoscilla massiliensis]|uniref:Cytochrome b/b6 domain-containing protein n=1 Tax=Vitreoscilla massiliensis TaxID=1689272 RepID=A0ABY4E1R0_9NEIS|nr:cytochrome b/b6 domain-containing protein [Vitreoscilla massiliensis]UOO89300.1 cytochrome b/b6 domain-containing protein [Vitreoscilla massiliensis]